MMVARFVNKLSVEEQEQISDLINKSSHFAYTQHFNFKDNLGRTNSLVYFLLYDEDLIVSYCKIIVSHLTKFPFIKTALINSALASTNKQTSIEAIKKIYTHYLKNKFARISIQTNLFIGNESEYIETYLQKDGFDFYHKHDRFNVSTLVIDLAKSKEEIMNEFSDDLKKNLKKSKNKNVIVKELTKSDDHTFLLEVFLKMAERRGLKEFTKSYFEKHINFALQNNNGKVFYSLTEENKVLGTIFIYNEGNSCVYHVGFSDPDEKKLPALHAVLFEAIMWAKDNSLKYFDLGGYGHYAKEGEQIFYINNFKLNFTKNFYFYQKRMYFDLNKAYCKVLNAINAKAK